MAHCLLCHLLFNSSSVGRGLYLTALLTVVKVHNICVFFVEELAPHQHLTCSWHLHPIYFCLLFNYSSFINSIVYILQKEERAVYWSDIRQQSWMSPIRAQRRKLNFQFLGETWIYQNPEIGIWTSPVDRRSSGWSDWRYFPWGPESGTSKVPAASALNELDSIVRHNTILCYFR